MQGMLAWEDEQPSNVVSLKDWRVWYYRNDDLGTPRGFGDESSAIVWQGHLSGVAQYA